MDQKNHSRRKFINRCFSLGGLFLGAAFLTNCRGKNKSSGDENASKNQSTSEDPCNDLTAVADGEIKKRESLGYVLKSNVPDNFCGNCSLYIPPKENEKCGGCILFKGPVYKEGHCVQWAAVAT